MVSLTLSVPEDLKKQMDEHAEMNWSEIARDAIRKKVDQLAVMDRLDTLTKRSKFSEKDALELGRLVRKGISEHHRKVHGKRNKTHLKPTKPR